MMLRWWNAVLDDAMLPLLKAIAPGYRSRMPEFRQCEPCGVELLSRVEAPNDMKLTNLPNWRGYASRRFAFSNPVENCESGDDQVSGRLLAVAEEAPWTLIIPGYSTGAIPGSGYSIFQTRQGRMLLERGINVALVDLPNHMERKRLGLSGESFFSPDLAQTKANVLQAAADAVGLLKWLHRESGQEPGVWGTSLGGCIAGLALTAFGQIRAGVLMEPLDNPGDTLAVLPGSREIRDELRRNGITPDEISRMLADVAPSSYLPAVDREQVLFLTPEWDRVVPTRFQHRLWEAWGRPPRLSFPTGHVGLAKDRQATLLAAEFLAERLRPPLH